MLAIAWLVMHKLISEEEIPHVHEDVKFSPIPPDLYNVTGITSSPAYTGFAFNFKKKLS